MEQSYRIMKLYKFLMEKLGVTSQKELSAKLGYNRSYLSQMHSGSVPPNSAFFAKLRSTSDEFVKISSRWVMTGEGDMLDGRDFLFVSQIPEPEHKDNAECESLSSGNNIPVIPCDIVRQPDIDVWDYVSNNIDNIEHLTLSQLFPDHDLLYRAIGNAMQPSIEKGDVLVLRRLPQSTQIINGECYVVDSLSLGILVRIVEDKGDSLLCTATCENFKPITVPKSDICNVFTIVGLIRQNIAPMSSNEPILLDELQHRTSQIDKLVDEVQCQGKRMDRVLNLIDK